MRVLADEGVGLDHMFAHGGIFRTAGVAQQLLAAAIGAPVAVAATASEGGAWGIAVLADYRRTGTDVDLGTHLGARVFADAHLQVVAPRAEDVAGYAAFLPHYAEGLAVERAAVAAIR
jgi:sugar (pentulose or hexulose) kinase